MKKKLLLLVACIFAISVSLCFADDKAKAIDLVNKGIDYILKNGEDKAFKEFTDKNPMFTQGELYIFVVDFNGLALAHGGNGALVGKSMYDLKDSNGNYFIRTIIEIAKTKGSGWSDYKWSNPKTKAIENKTTYVKRVPGKNYFVGCGIYKK
jgi:cytochrome c